MCRLFVLLRRVMKTVYFKCRLSGCVVGFTEEYDIKQMREHPDYDEVTENQDTPKKSKG